MIVKLTYHNNLSIPVTLASDFASGQPLLPQQSVQMMFELHEGEDGTAEIVLYCQPSDSGR